MNKRQEMCMSELGEEKKIPEEIILILIKRKELLLLFFFLLFLSNELLKNFSFLLTFYNRRYVILRKVIYKNKH